MILQHCDGHGGDAFTAAGETQVFGSGGLDVDAGGFQAEILGDRVGEVPVLCLTAHVGCCEAAIGPMSAAMAVLAMQRGVIPGALNRERPIAAYRGPTSSLPQTGPVRNALVTVFTREGVNAALVLRAL